MITQEGMDFTIKGIVFTCTHFCTCTYNSTYLYEEQHRQIGTLELKPVDIHNKHHTKAIAEY